jgi:ADP-ribose pyrophosphatase
MPVTAPAMGAHRVSEAIPPEVVRQIFKGRIFSVAIETVTLPHGHRLDAEVIRHPPSVVLVPIDAEGRVILIRQYRHAVGRWLWELPAGSTDPGEDERLAAARECQEEIGLVPGALTPLGAFFPTPGYCDEEMVFFLATGLRVPGEGDPVAHADVDEHIEPRAFSVEEAQGLIAAGDIADLKTVAGLALLASHAAGEPGSAVRP